MSVLFFQRTYMWRSRFQFMQEIDEILLPKCKFQEPEISGQILPWFRRRHLSIIPLFPLSSVTALFKSTSKIEGFSSPPPANTQGPMVKTKAAPKKKASTIKIEVFHWVIAGRAWNVYLSHNSTYP